MTLTIKINMDNASFGDGDAWDRGREVAMVLRDMAKVAESGGIDESGFPCSPRDSNGNCVGTAEVSE